MEITKLTKRDGSLVVEYQNDEGKGVREEIPLEDIQEWAEAEDILTGVKDSVDYDGSHKQEVYNLDFEGWFYRDFGIDDFTDFWNYRNTQNASLHN